MALSAPEQLMPHHDIDDFSCGKAALDGWLRTKALRNQQHGFSVVMAVHDAGRVVGYYALAPTSVSREAAPRAVRTGQAPNPLPCLLLGQLAVDRAWAGRRLGTALLGHAFRRAVAAATLVGGRALVVHATDADAARFWGRHGFVPARDDPSMLFRPMGDIAASVTSAAG
jgi:predicted N-acetyltransferase YhbS